MVDIPANDTTTAEFEGGVQYSSLPFVGTFSGELEVAGDRDWIRVELTAGTTYEFHMHFQEIIGTAGDAVLRIYSSAGVLLNSNDDRAAGDQNSLLSFTAQTTGTYYIEASASGDDRAGDYAIFFTASDGPSNHFLDDANNTYTGTLFQRVLGGKGNDTIDIGAGVDALGEQGNDTITGNSLVNRISGGLGADIIDGGGGNDFLFGDAGNDTISGGAGNDWIWGGSGDDTLSGNGLGVLFGGSGNDTLYGDALGIMDGGAGNDKLYGTSNGPHHFIGGAGADEMYGGDGGDFFRVRGTDNIGDTIRGGAGIDRMQLEGGVAVTLSEFDAAISEVEAWDGNGLGLFGTSGANTFNFAALTELKLLPFIDGMGGNDSITGSAFDDDLRGGSGKDTLNGGGGDDIVNGGAQADVLFGGAGLDDFDFNTVNESKKGANRDTIQDFVRGEDEIDLSGIDAKSGAGNQKFKWIGKQGFHGTKGELHYVKKAGFVFVEGDINGDAKADFQIKVMGVTKLSALDFDL